MELPRPLNERPDAGRGAYSEGKPLGRLMEPGSSSSGREGTSTGKPGLTARPRITEEQILAWLTVPDPDDGTIPLQDDR